MSLINGFQDMPPKIVRTYTKQSEHDGYFIIDHEQYGSLMWVGKEHLRYASMVPEHQDDAVLDDGPPKKRK